MFTLSVKIGFTRKQKEMTDVTRHHCGQPYRVHIKNIRAVNYCSTCK
jgi:hypothetical protein